MQTTTICGLTKSGPMNIVLLRENDRTDGNTVRLADYRAYHLINVIKVEINQTLRVGLINGIVAQRTSNNSTRTWLS